jgi:mannose-6-phosphate isomerase-like protein (cupin superfamily)
MGGSADAPARAKSEHYALEELMISKAHTVEILRAKEGLVAAGGGYEVVHESPGLELGVYVLVAPEPDRQQPHDDDEIYVVLEGLGTLEVDGERIQMHEGQATFVPAGAEHQFVGYEQLSVLVIFEKTPKS